MPSTELTAEDFTDDKIDTLTLLVKCGLAASKGEGRRLVQQGGISVNDEKVTDFATMFEKTTFTGDGAVIRKGKKVRTISACTRFPPARRARDGRLSGAVSFQRDARHAPAKRGS